MAIKGLTDSGSIMPRFPRLGKLRKGGEKVKGGYGPDLDHFRFTSENPDIVQAFHNAYGKQPVALHVYLPYPDVENNFSTWKEQWAAGGLVHRCDGETCQIWRTNKGTYSRESEPCPGGCDEVGRLTVILPELIRSGFVGYVTLETHSLHDMMNMTATLLAVAQERTGDPRGLQGIEFVLRRKKETISTPGKEGVRVRRDKWLVSLEPVASWAQTYLALSAGAGTALAIAAPVDEETGEIIDAPARSIIVEQPGQPDSPPTIWQDWTRPDHAQEWAMTQGKFGHPAHMINAYAKVKAALPAGAKAADMWQAWVEYVNAHAPAKSAEQPAEQPTDDDPDGWGDIDAHGVQPGERPPF